VRLASRVEVPRGGVLERKVPTVCCAGSVKEEGKGEEEEGRTLEGGIGEWRGSCTLRKGRREVSAQEEGEIEGK
jgi:hypothetical protein